MKGITMLMMVTMSIAFIQIPLSCKTDGNNAGYEFYYYPSKNVYYSALTKNYIYSLNGGKTWDSIPGEVDNNSEALGERKMIQSAGADVWKQNDQHRKEYKGTLYNVQSRDSFASDAGVVSDKKAISRGVSVTKKENAKPEKRGFRKFLDKIFGKKKKTTKS